MKIGIIAAGQLGRMLALAGIPLGFTFRFLDPSNEGCAGGLGEVQGGALDDPATLCAFARGLDVVTCEFENVPHTALELLQGTVPVEPRPEVFHVAQDRRREKGLFQQLEIPVPRFLPIETEGDLLPALQSIGTPAVLKGCRFGYDGKGQVVIQQLEDAAGAFQTIGAREAVLEEFVPFEREVSIIGARGRGGEIRFYPLGANSHRDGILRSTRAPFVGGGEIEHTAHEYARRILEHFHYIGILAVEFFLLNGRLYASEMAPRVHNSGHWTIEGAETSQFENHLRAITGLPLGDTAPRGHSLMINFLGEIPPRTRLLSHAGFHLHDYAKSPRPNRKVGHLTIRADTPELLASREKELEEILQ